MKIPRGNFVDKAMFFINVYLLYLQLPFSIIFNNPQKYRYFLLNTLLRNVYKCFQRKYRRQ